MLFNKKCYIFNRPKCIFAGLIKSEVNTHLVKVHFGSCQTFMLELICESGQRLLVVNYFRKNALSQMFRRHSIIAACELVKHLKGLKLLV